MYVHRHYAAILGEPFWSAAFAIPDAFDYTVVKFNKLTGAVTFVHSPDFDSAPEPTVGDSWIVRGNGTVGFMPQGRDPFVYHQKWLMVRNDYAGFDVAESQERSRLCLAVPGIDRTRIGRRSHWLSVVLPQVRKWYATRCSEFGAIERVLT